MGAKGPRPRKSERGLYVYGIVPAREAVVPDGLIGMDGRSPVRLVERENVAAVVSEVPLDEFGDESLKENVSRPQWLEATVRAHEAVLERLLAAVPVVPMRFGTIFRRDEHVREMLAEHEMRLSSALSRVRGKREWGVKCFLDRRVLTDYVQTREDALALARDMAAKPEGRAYFARKRLDQFVRAEVERIAGACVNDAHERLASCASEARANPVRGEDAPGRSGAMLLNGAYLVEASRDGEFAAALSTLAEKHGRLGLTYEVTGPWPPYNFVSGSEEAA